MVKSGWQPTSERERSAVEGSMCYRAPPAPPVNSGIRTMKRLVTLVSGDRTTAQFARFLLTGLINTAAGFLIFAVLIWMAVPVVLALLAANTVGVFLNFQTIGRIVFQRAEWSLLLRFSGVYVSIFLLNWFILSQLVRLGVGTILAQALLSPFLALCSFFAHKYLVFEWRRT